MGRYSIIDGVRRAKAAQLLGLQSIWAQHEDGSQEFQVSVDDLLSPKRAISLATTRERRRWENVLEGMREEPDLLPPIIVRDGDTGMPIRDVTIGS